MRTRDGASAVLKMGQSEHEHLLLRRWNGDGAVRLLRADPHRGALLLERLRPESLERLSDVDACDVVAGLYGRLHVPAMPQLPTLTSVLEQWEATFAALPRNAAIPHRLVEQATTLCRELATGPNDSVLHGNLHYDNVLAAQREPWLAVLAQAAQRRPALLARADAVAPLGELPTTSASESSGASMHSSSRRASTRPRTRLGHTARPSRGDARPRRADSVRRARQGRAGLSPYRVVSTRPG